MENKNTMNRRNFLKNSTVGMVGAGVLGGKSLLSSQDKAETGTAKIKEYRTLGRTGFQVSDISTGGPGDESLLNALLDAGVNYIDNAESYGNGQSEILMGKVLKNRDRKKIFVTTKMLINEFPGLPVKKEEVSKEGILQRFRKSLERMQTDYADCLMIHSIADVQTVKHQAFHEAITQLKAEGRVKYAGFSNHGSFHPVDAEEVMGKIVMAAAEDGRFDVVLLAYNYLQQDMSEEALRVCREKKIGVTLMKTNPVGSYFGIKEGIAKLEKEGKDVPEFYGKALAKFKGKYEQAEGFLKKYNLEDPGEIKEAAIKFCLNNPAVNTVCVSFRNFEDVDKYVKLSGKRLTPADEAALSAYSQSFGQFYCRHACGVCESQCPHNVPVNTIMRFNHYFAAQGREKYAMERYASLESGKADVCQNCSGHCEAACPYNVPVRVLLSLAHRNLTLA
ncbi:MAG: aldo/keto reductase [Candidatus Aminicenantes bacterium]|nr:aldo/keto reductase [Candidatus Aminicenantes bacterium]